MYEILSVPGESKKEVRDGATEEAALVTGWLCEMRERSQRK